MRTKDIFIFNYEDVSKLNELKVISSDFFLRVLDKYLKALGPDDQIKVFLEEILDGEVNVTLLKDLIKSLYLFGFAKLSIANPLYLKNRDLLLELLDGIYDTYRLCSRYLLGSRESLTSKEFISAINSFSSLIMNTYRHLYEDVLGSEQKVYRELASGVNGGFLISNNSLLPSPSLGFLKDTPLIETIITKPPFMVKTFSNKRVGYFKKEERMVETGDIDPKALFLLPIKIQDRIGLCYIHKDFLSTLMGLGTLFEIATKDEILKTKASFIMIYGINKDLAPHYYQVEGQYVGVISAKKEMDYFGYAKKMILTLFNLSMIDEGKLPIHGAGVTIRLKNGIKKNIAILGDSGAGKSETLEALGHSSDDCISSITTIFDDMGTFHIKDGQIYMSGTEIGAFVRLDDLDNSYSLRAIDRAIFYNIEETNSRVVVPATSYKTTCSSFPVDYFFFANNYEEIDEGLKLIEDKNTAIDIFVSGLRVALKTTSEKGLVSTFFSNPFGPMQKKEACLPLINEYFDLLYKNQIKTGVLYTQLSLDKHIGTKKAAEALINLIKTN